MADQDYPNLYEDMEASAQRTRDAAISFEHVLGGPEADMVPVNGYPAQPTIAGRVKTRIDPLVDEIQDRVDGVIDTVEAAAESVKRFAGVHAVAPSTRYDGTPLQSGDEYQNSTTGLRYNWSGTSWVPLNASVQQVVLDLAEKDDPSRGAGMSGHKEGTVGTYLDTLTTGLGDISPVNLLQIHVGDSTTEQAGGNGFMFDYITDRWRGVGMPLNAMLGMVNFGGSGYTLKGFIEDPVDNAFVGPTGVMPGVSAGVGQYDFYGHKPTGKVSLATALKWRAGLPATVKNVHWPMSYGINDLILTNTIGNSSPEVIATYIAPMLVKAIGRIQAAFPGDSIILRIPNPMTARPFNASFPSAAAYPTFDSDLPAAQALVANWNAGLRLAYQKAQNIYPRTVLFDSWAKVFGNSDPSVPAGTTSAANPTLGDRVHPSQIGYRYLGLEFCNFLFGNAQTRQAYSGRRAMADAKINNLWTGNPWDYDPQYFRGNPKFKELGSWNIVGAGSNYMDIAVDSATLKKILAGYGGGRIFCTVGVDDKSGGSFLLGNFTGLAIGASGANARITGVAPPTFAQGTRAVGTFYTDNYLSPPRISAAGALVQGQGVYAAIMDAVPAGLASISVATSLAVPSTVVVEIYRHIGNVRTPIATVSLGPNTFTKTILSGTDFTAIPSVGLLRETWEMLPTAATSVPAGCALQLTLNPN